jgi:hypothetical protein
VKFFRDVVKIFTEAVRIFTEVVKIFTEAVKSFTEVVKFFTEVVKFDPVPGRGHSCRWVWAPAAPGPKTESQWTGTGRVHRQR